MQKGFYAEYFEVEDRHWWFVGRRRILLRVLDDHLGTGGGRRVLDVGCGTGTMVRHLARYGEAQGVDGDEAAVEFCRQRGVTQVQHAPGTELPFEAETFDLVTALDVIEHIDDDVAALREMHRVLRPTGTLLVTVPAYMALWGAQDEISHHKRRYRRTALRRRVEEAGFTVRRASYFNTFLFPPIAAVRLARRVVPAKGELKSDFALTGSGRLDDALGHLFGAEAAPVSRVGLPFGVSILALGVKPSGG